MFTDKLIIAAILAVITSLALGFYTGQDWANTKAEAAKVEMMALHQERLEFEQDRVNRLSDRLVKAEGRITIKTVEVIKYVPQVTTGKPCLSPAAVSLLQPGGSTGIRPPTRESVAESPPAFAATDTDVAYWIADANRHYEICAARLNTLVDYVDGSDK